MDRTYEYMHHMFWAPSHTELPVLYCRSRCPHFRFSRRCRAISARNLPTNPHLGLLHNVRVRLRRRRHFGHMRTAASRRSRCAQIRHLVSRSPQRRVMREYVRGLGNNIRRQDKQTHTNDHQKGIHSTLLYLNTHWLIAKWWQSIPHMCNAETLTPERTRGHAVHSQNARNSNENKSNPTTPNWNAFVYKNHSVWVLNWTHTKKNVWPLHKHRVSLFAENIYISPDYIRAAPRAPDDHITLEYSNACVCVCVVFCVCVLSGLVR